MPTAQPNQSLQNGCAALELIAASPLPLATGAIAAALGVHKSVASRLLGTLADLGYLARVGRGQWRPQAGLMALSAFGLANSPLAGCQDALGDLIAATGCIVALGFLWRDRVVYLFHSGDRHEVRGFGKVYPVRASSIGRLLSAGRTRRHVLVRDAEPGRFSVAVPLRFHGFPYGLAVAGPRALWRGAATLAALRAAAARIERLDDTPPDRSRP